jgi:hypothetical protein
VNITIYYIYDKDDDKDNNENREKFAIHNGEFSPISPMFEGMAAHSD